MTNEVTFKDQALGLGEKVDNAYVDLECFELLSNSSITERRTSLNRQSDFSTGAQAKLLFDKVHVRQKSECFSGITGQKSNRWQNLYDDSRSIKIQSGLKRLLRQDPSEEECTFKPVLGKRTHEIAESRNQVLMKQYMDKNLVSSS